MAVMAVSLNKDARLCLAHHTRVWIRHLRDVFLFIDYEGDQGSTPFPPTEATTAYVPTAAVPSSAAPPTTPPPTTTTEAACKSGNNILKLSPLNSKLRPLIS